MNSDRMYKPLDIQARHDGEYRLIPIRHEDRWDIMKWRNEQIYHLRQSKPLTISDQDNYFNDTIASLFKEEYPPLILFSFLKKDRCIGYGGLVHINWEDKNAELSFIMDTELEKNSFSEVWSSYLPLIEQVGFDELNLHKIYTYAFDLRPHLYNVLEQNGYEKDAELKEHCYIAGGFKNVVVHRKLNRYGRKINSAV